MDLANLRVKELTELCKQLGVKTGGRKADIVARIQSSAAFQHQHSAKLQRGRNARSSGNKRGGTDSGSPVSSATKKLKGLRADDEGPLHALFDRFRDPESEEDCITDDGILALCAELGVDPQDPVLLALSFVMGAATMCVFTRAEFLRGLQKLRCRSLQDLRDQLPALRRRLQTREQFTSIYSFTFSFSKDPTQKSLSLEIALGLWALLLPGRFPWLHHWLQFVRVHCRNSVSKDLWMQVLEFGEQIAPDLGNFDENGAWPVLLDDFATHMQELVAKLGLPGVKAAEAALAAKAASSGDADDSMIVDDM